MSITEVRSTDYSSFVIPVVTVSIIAGGVFITLAAFQILPHGVNAISQLGELGKGIGYGMMGGGVAIGVILLSVRYSLQENKVESNLLGRSTLVEILEEIKQKFNDLCALITNDCDLEKIKKIHAKHPQVFQAGKGCRTELGGNLLHLAIHYDRVEFIQWLCPQYPELMREKNNLGVTPFDMACNWFNFNKLEITRCFLNNGVQVTEPNDRLGPFHKAIQNGNSELIQLLLNSRPGLIHINNHLGETPLACAKRAGASEAILLLLTEVELNEPEKKMEALKQFHQAIREKDAATVRLSLQKRPELINMTDNLGKRAFDIAQKAKAPFEINLLLANSLVANKAKNDEEIPSSYKSLVEKIIENDCSLDELEKIYVKNPHLFHGGEGFCSENGENLLHWAVRYKKVDLAIWLYDKHPLLADQVSESDLNPILLAVDYEQIKLIKHILADKYNHDILRAFSLAITQENNEIVTLFLQEKPELVHLKSYLESTDKKGISENIVRLIMSFKDLEFMISLGCNLEDLKKIHSANSRIFQGGKGYCLITGENLLHLAIRHNNIDLAKWLYDQHMQLTIQEDKQRETPLQLIVVHDNIEMMNFVLEAKPELIKLKNFKGQTLLEFAKLYPLTKEIIPFLMEAESKFDQSSNSAFVIEKEKTSKSPSSADELFSFINKSGCNLEEIKKIHAKTPHLFLEQGSWTDIGANLLHWAVQEEKVEFVQWFCTEYPGLMQKENAWGTTPFDSAVNRYSSKKLEIIKCFLDHGYQFTEPKVDKNFEEPKGYNDACRGFGPFHRAIFQDNVELVRVLLDARPELIMMKNWFEEAPLEYAQRLNDSSKRKIPDLIALLKERQELQAKK